MTNILCCELILIEILHACIVSRWYYFMALVIDLIGQLNCHGIGWEDKNTLTLKMTSAQVVKTSVMSPPVLFRTTLTRMVTLDKLLILLVSNHWQYQFSCRNHSLWHSLHWALQSINQSINQSVSQSVSQSINQSLFKRGKSSVKLKKSLNNA